MAAVDLNGTTRLTEALPPSALHAMVRIEDALDAPNRERAAKVGKALGFRYGWKPRPDFDETVTRVCVWSVRELDTMFARVGGTVTAQQVERTLSDGDTYTVTEVTITVDLPGIGTIEVFTDWDPADEGYGYDLPVIRAIQMPQEIASAARASAAQQAAEQAKYLRDCATTARAA